MLAFLLAPFTIEEGSLKAMESFYHFRLRQFVFESNLLLICILRREIRPIWEAVPNLWKNRKQGLKKAQLKCIFNILKGREKSVGLHAW